MIAYVMLYSVAVATPIVLAAMLVAAVLRRYGRAERFVWLATLVLAFALPVLAILRPDMTGGARSGTSLAVTPTGIIGLPTIFVVPDAPAEIPFGSLLVWAWLVASAVLVARLGVAAVRLLAARRSWRSATLDGVSVWMTHRLGPAVAGLVRPRVLVPEWIAGMPTHQRSLVLLHEQEHIRAGDPWLVAASRVAPIFAPWNPVIWVLASRLLRAVELDCDRRVLRQRPDVRAYGATLLEVSSRDSGRLVAVAAFAESEAPLRGRILSMTTPPRTVSVVALLTSMVLGVALIGAAFQVPVPAVGQRGTDEAVAENIRVDVQVVRGREVEREDAQPVRPTQPSRPVVREEQRVEPSARPTTSEQRIAEVVGRRRSDFDLSAEPTFTPFTAAPVLMNMAEVQRALVDEYPPVIRDAGMGGVVTVWFFIDEDGLVGQTRVDTSSGLPELDEAALSVAGVMRFSPARNRDERVPVWVSLPVRFQIR